MSIIDQGAGAPASGLARWIGYGLCVIGFALRCSHRPGAAR